MRRSIRLFLAIASIVWLASSPASAQPDDTGVEASATPKTRLYVRTIPPGAQVTVDGEALGTSDGLFLVPAGAVNVSVAFDGHAPQVQQVEIAEGQITRIEIALNDGARPAAAPESPASSPAAFVLQSSRRDAVVPVPLSKIDDQLAKPARFEFADVPLRDVVAQIGVAHGVGTALDRRALENDGIDLETPITIKVADIPLASALDALGEQYSLAWSVTDDDITFTTPDAAAERGFPRVYDVSDLIFGRDANLQYLVDLIQNSVAVHTWNTVGGPGSLQPDQTDEACRLIIRQEWSVHRRIAGFLERLRRLKATPKDERAPLAAEGYWSDAAAAVSARRALDGVMDVDFAELPLAEAIALVSEQSGVPIALDDRALGDAGCDHDTPVTLSLKGKPLGQVLDRMLDQIRLTVAIAHDRLVVTTKDSADQRTTVALYPVDRLIGRGRSFQTLIDILQANVTPQAWNTVGGSASVMPVSGDPTCLVISHTTAGHREVDALLGSLR